MMNKKHRESIDVQRGACEEFARSGAGVSQVLTLVNSNKQCYSESSESSVTGTR